MDVKEKPEENFEFKNVWNQYFATFAVNLIMFSHGVAMVWTSSAIPYLQSDKTPLVSGPLSDDDVSWIGSIDCIGALVGALTLGYFISLMGLKRAILLLTIPEAAFWVLIYFGNHYYYIFAARVISGYAGGGIVPPLVLYVTEIANDNIRGRLASSMMILRNIGILISYLMGAKIDYYTISLVSIIFPIVFLFIFLMFPNTPQYHLQKGNTQKAEKALKFYKGYRGKSKQEEDALSQEFERLKAFASDRHHEERAKLSDYFVPSTMKGFMICFALNAFSQLTANHTIKTYAVLVFQRTGADMDPYISSYMVALALIFGALLTTYLADTLGRKILNFGSLAGSAIGLFAVAIYYYLKINEYDISNFHWVPVASLSFVIFISSAGINALAYVCSVEYLPLKIRTSGYVIVVVWINIATFTCTKLFPILLNIVDVHGVFLMFGVGSTIGALFVAFCMEETSGKSLDEVGLDEVGETQVQRVSVCINL